MRRNTVWCVIMAKIVCIHGCLSQIQQSVRLLAVHLGHAPKLVRASGQGDVSAVDFSAKVHALLSWRPEILLLGNLPETEPHARILANLALSSDGKLIFFDIPCDEESAAMKLRRQTVVEILSAAGCVTHTLHKSDPNGLVWEIQRILSPAHCGGAKVVAGSPAQPLADGCFQFTNPQEAVQPARATESL